MSVDRIMPVLYSPADSSTPSTPTASDANVAPVRARLTAVLSPLFWPGGPPAVAPAV